jgi:hypothetical protein
MKKDYFNPPVFDSMETKIMFQVNFLKSDLIKTKTTIEVKAQMGTLTKNWSIILKDHVENCKETLCRLNTIPFIGFYKRYNYFNYPKGKALQDINLN